MVLQGPLCGRVGRCRGFFLRGLVARQALFFRFGLYHRQVNRHIALGCACALLAGCVSRPRQVSRGEVFAHVPELRASGRARVELEAGGATTLAMTQRVDVEAKTSWLWGLVDGTRVSQLTVATLIENCPDVAPFREDSAGVPLSRIPPLNGTAEVRAPWEWGFVSAGVRGWR